MLLPTREVGELVMSQYLLLEKKLHLGPRPPMSDNLNIFSLDTIAGVYSTTSQNFHASTYTESLRISDESMRALPFINTYYRYVLIKKMASILTYLIITEVFLCDNTQDNLGPGFGGLPFSTIHS